MLFSPLHKLGLVAALTLAAWLHGAWYWSASVRSEFQRFKDGTSALGEEARKLAQKTKEADLARKDAADEENRRNVADLRATVDRLRNERARGGYLPTAAASAGSAERACFDRAELERAIGRLDEDVSGIVAAGDEARLKLDTGRRWAQQAQ
jgi:hypothetical protein